MILAHAILAFVLVILSVLFWKLAGTIKTTSDEERTRELDDMCDTLYPEFDRIDGLDLLYKQTYREMIRLRNQDADYEREYRDTLLIWSLRNRYIKDSAQAETTLTYINKKGIVTHG